MREPQRDPRDCLSEFRVGTVETSPVTFCRSCRTMCTGGISTARPEAVPLQQEVQEARLPERTPRGPGKPGTDSSVSDSELSSGTGMRHEARELGTGIWNRCMLWVHDASCHDAACMRVGVEMPDRGIHLQHELRTTFQKASPSLDIHFPTYMAAY